MKLFLKIGILIFVIILAIVGFLLRYLFYVIPTYRADLLKSSQMAVSAFLSDKSILTISSNGLLLKESIKFCHIKDRTRAECRKKLEEYENIILTTPGDVSYYICDNKWIVRGEDKYVEVHISSPGDIRTSGLHFSYNNNGWLKYYVDTDKFHDAGPCYPWQDKFDLEDYWKQYGKATSEQIQAVIDKGKPTQ